MRRIFLTCFLISTTTAFAQRHTYSKAPDAVRIAFSRQFPGIDDPRWEIEGDKYEAHFRHDGQVVSALYEKDGTWKETERKISVKSLPPDAKLYIEKNYSGRNARTASVIKLPSDETNYVAHINYADVIFDKNGKYLKTEKE